MRIRSLALLSLLALTLLCSRAASAAETITFEEMSPDGPGTGGVIPVLNFYAAQGVIFRAVALDYSRGIAIPNFAHSGTKGIETCYATEFCSAPIEMTFTQAQTYVKLFVGFDGSLSQAITVVMHAFAADGSEVGQATATLAASTSATPIQTPMETTANSATIVRVTIGIESDGVPSFTNGLAVDDVEFDTAGPQPPCPALQNPTVSISQPANDLTVQFNQFPLAFIVNSGDPFAVTTVTDSGSGQSHSVSYPGFTGTFGPTSVHGLLVPGLSTLTVAVKDCRGSAQASVSINFTPIATDERFHVLGFEATQVIQNIPSGVPLIADKPTVVRVYLRVTGSTPQITNVRGTLFAYRPANSFFDVGLPLDGSVHSSNFITVDQSDDLKAKRLSLDKSLNFDLPADWITQGAVHFELRLDVDNSPSSPVLIPCDGCNLKFGTGGAIFSTFHPMPTFNLRIIGLNYTTDPQVAANNPPRALDFALLESWVRRTFPAGQFTVTTNTVIADNVFPFSCNAANAQLAAIRATEVAAGIGSPHALHRTRDQHRWLHARLCGRDPRQP